MANGQSENEFPTMIIPRGTEIKVNEKGQLSIKTPGNLVIQNSGHYSLIHSEKGSIRIEENVNVEAVDVHAEKTCYVLGKLTAWHVKAERLTLENQAEAYVMLRESGDLDVAKTARLVGNFADEREVYLLLSRYANQLKGLPDTVSVGEPPPAFQPPQRSQAPAEAEKSDAQEDKLSLAEVILEREGKSGIYDADSQQAIIEIHHALKERDGEKLKQVFSALVGQIKEPTPDLLEAFDYIRSHF